MKGAVAYIIVLGATFLLSGLVVVGTLMFRPDLLRGSTAVVADTLAAKNAPVYKREFAGPTIDDLIGPPEPKIDSVTIMRDSMTVLLASLAEANKRIDTLSKTPPPAPVVVEPVVPDSTVAKEKKAKAKMLEAMPAEEAAKILANLTDEETRTLLKYVKARQAAKIVAAIQPDRASRLFR